MVIDWMMRLPEQLERALWRRIEEKERSRVMPYMFSFERIARKDGRKEGLLEGRKEGRQEGRREGQLLLLSNMLAERFGVLPAHAQERLAQGTSAELLAWSKAFVRAATLDEVFNT
jgi:predicted transposase YdaD